MSQQYTDMCNGLALVHKILLKYVLCSFELEACIDPVFDQVSKHLSYYRLENPTKVLESFYTQRKII